MQDTIRRNVPLAPLTTINLGGPARFLVVCKNEEDIRRALALSHQENVPLHILGGGSNTVFADEGFQGVVAKIELKGLTFTEENETVLVSAAAGEVWDEVVQASLAKGLAGIECLSGIPGLVGATPMQNVGAYGQDVAETIEDVTTIDRRTGKSVTFTNAACTFAYRVSRFKKEDLGTYIVTNVRFRLRRDAVPTIRYPQVQAQLEKMYGTVDIGTGQEALEKVRETVLHLRRSKSMVVNPSDPHSRSCGSFFTNPIISAEKAKLVQATQSGQQGYTVKGGVKMSAAWLVEQAGFARGQRFGNVGISPNHSLALVNYGGTTKELLAVATTIQKKVKELFDITLELEPVAVLPHNSVQ
ncbi:MAG: UDP-N-acetylmuramate dehydrogenase [Candidatus Andersenbacteria bacterium]|nr:UDP-N-acetylmuramate dehydrogenase [Candidatus Andersenbacteria bacterium]